MTDLAPEQIGQREQRHPRPRRQVHVVDGRHVGGQRLVFSHGPDESPSLGSALDGAEHLGPDERQPGIDRGTAAGSSRLRAFTAPSVPTTASTVVPMPPRSPSATSPVTLSKDTNPASVRVRRRSDARPGPSFSRSTRACHPRSRSADRREASTERADASASRSSAVVSVHASSIHRMPGALAPARRASETMPCIVSGSMPRAATTSTLASTRRSVVLNGSSPSIVASRRSASALSTSFSWRRSSAFASTVSIRFWSVSTVGCPRTP